MNRQRMIEKVERSQIKEELDVTPKPGDTVKVHVKVVEGEKSRTQIFQGVVINVRGASTNRTFTVRKVSMGVAVERIFPLYSPTISKLEVVRGGRVRRAKLFYLRDRTGKASKLAELDDNRSSGPAAKAAIAPAPEPVKVEEPEPVVEEAAPVSE